MGGKALKLQTKHIIICNFDARLVIVCVCVFYVYENHLNFLLFLLNIVNDTFIGSEIEVSSKIS